MYNIALNKFATVQLISMCLLWKYVIFRHLLYKYQIKITNQFAVAFDFFIFILL